MAKTKKRILALVLTLVMVFTLLPTTAFADESGELTAEELYAISGDMEEMNMTTMFALASAALGLDGEYPKSLTFTGDGIDKTIKMEEAAACEAVVSITAKAVYYDGRQVRVFSNGTASNLDSLNIHTEKAATYNIHTEKVATYIFKDLGGNEISEAKQILKAGETLQVPAAPEKDHAIFTGWAYEVDGKLEYVTQGMTQATLTANVTYEVYPQFEDAYYVFFHDGSTVLKTVKVAKGGTISKADYNDACAAYTPTSGYVLSGWKIGSTSGDTFTMETKVNEDLNVYPVESDSIFVTFDSQGGTPVPMTEVDANGKVDKPTVPTRIGYTFKYWSEKENGEAFDFNTQITADETLYAIWEGNSGTNYTVIHWQENADYDNKYLPEYQRDPEQYSFYLAESKTGVSGEMTKAVANTYMGFTAKPVTQMEIAGDGSTIVNIYYDRNVYEVKFYTSSGTISETCGKKEHTHEDGCYGCGKEEHRHSHDECCTITGWHVSLFCNHDKCPFGGAEHTHKKCNIICGLEEHTHNFTCYTYSNQPQEIEKDRITAKYGADIRSAWPGMNWKTAPDSTTSQVNLFTMPLNGDEFYQAEKSQDTVKAYYYVEIIPGETVGSDVPTVVREKKTYKLDHTDRSYGEGYRVTSEDRYSMKGFTCNMSLSPTNGQKYDNAQFFYDRNSYDIVFVNGGNVGEPVSKKYEESIADVSYTPDRPAGVSKDAIFAGWYDNEQCLGNAYIFAGKTMPAKNITLYAKWTTQPLTIKVYASVDAVGIEDVDKSLTLQVEVGSPLNKTDALVDFEKKINAAGNPDFLGWYLYDAETATMTPFLFGTILNVEVTLVARWRNSGYQVTYNANGGKGTVPVDPMSYSAGASAKVMSGAGLSKSDEGFLYWTKDAGETDAKFYPNQYIPVPQGGVTLYANYGKVAVSTVTVTYKANGGTGADVTTKVGANNDQFTVGAYPTEFKPPEGKEFDSWNTKDVGDGTKYAPGDLARADKNGDNILYAQYKDKTVTVTYDANGGSWASEVSGYEMGTGNTTASKELPAGTKISAIDPAPQQSDKVFTGWYYDEECTEPVVFGSYSKLYMDVILYAGWKDTEPNSVSYTICQHYIGEDGLDDAAVNLSGLSAPKDTPIKTLYADKAKDQTYYYQNYIYVAEGTKVDPDGDKLTQDGTTIDLYYYLDEWSDLDKDPDPNKPGDGIPDKYQVTIKYVSADDKMGSVTGLKEEVKTIYTTSMPIMMDTRGTVRVSGSKAEANDRYAFEKWTNDLTADEIGSAEFNGKTLLVTGGNTYTFTANFKQIAVDPGQIVPKAAAYQIQHYKEQEGGSYVLAETDLPAGFEELGKTATVKDTDINTYDGYVLDTVEAQTVRSAVVTMPSKNDDGSLNITTLKLYYAKDTNKDQIPDKYQAVVNFKAGSNGTLKGNTTQVITLKDANGNYAEEQTVEVTGPTASANSRYDFDGWTGDAKCNSSAFKAEMKLEGGKSYTVTANFSRRSSGGGSHSGGTTIKDPEVPLGGLQLNKDDHFAYIKGYADGTVRPNNFITRAQVATIFYRLMTKETRTMYFSESNDFSDVSDDYWANKAISTLSNAGIITGFYDGTFRPNAFITRAQFAAIAARFSVVTEDLPNPFSDVPEGYWAEDLIAFAADVGWVNGYADGTFRPTANITRAAAMKLINNVLERQVDEDGLLKNATQWNDCTPDDWCYYIVMEATNSHDWERRSKKSLVEDWTALTADPVWDE